MSKIKILNDVCGFEERKNTIAYHPPSVNQDPSLSPRHPQVIIFPGDIQDFASVMTKAHSCRDFVEWSYEATLKIFAAKFPTCCLWLIKPSKKAYQCVCNYKNFVESESIMGVPVHSVDFNGLKHLGLLMKNSRAQLNLSDTADKTILAGFSKGCVVLNQVVYELSSFVAPPDVSASPPSLNLVQSLLAMVWLDGGHSGEEGAWVTDAEIIRAVANQKHLNIFFSIHVTPYQVRDEHRPWKGEEKTRFVELLREMKFQFHERIHFEDEAKSIDNHFRILSDFDPSHVVERLAL